MGFFKFIDDMAQQFSKNLIDQQWYKTGFEDGKHGNGRKLMYHMTLESARKNLSDLYAINRATLNQKDMSTLDSNIQVMSNYISYHSGYEDGIRAK